MIAAFVARDWSRARLRRRAACIVPLAMAMVLALMPVLPARAQVVVSPGPSVTVTGTGEATVPAETATVQLLIGQNRRQFEFSQDGSGSSFGIEVGAGPDEGFATELALEATPQATPEMAVDEAEDAAEPDEGRRGGRERRERPERAEPRPIDAERLGPVVDAIVASGGIAREAVAIDLSPLATEPFGNRRESARLDFEIAQPDPEALTALIAAASDAAAADGMVIQVAGVLYNPVDCAVVEREAAADALADAEVQAGSLAELLGVTLGGVVSASTNPYFSFDPEVSGCSGQQSAFYDSSYGGLGTTVPVFDPSAEAEVEVYAMVTVSYAIVEG